MKGNRLLAAFCVLTPCLAIAEVADSSANGFTVKVTLNIRASPDDVYRRLIHNVGDWWDSSHTFSGDSHNLTIEEKTMGCFCEKLARQGGVRHMEVAYLDPGKTLVLLGALGPLQTLAATGSMSIQFTPMEGGTKLQVVYAVTGYVPAGMNTWAAPVDTVLNLQFNRLKNYAESGDAQTKGRTGSAPSQPIEAR